MEMQVVRDDLTEILKPYSSEDSLDISVWSLTGNRYNDPLSKETFDALTEFLKDEGCSHPVIVGHYNVIICGKARAQAWMAVGFESIPVVRINVTVTYEVPWWKRLWRKLTR